MEHTKEKTSGRRKKEENFEEMIEKSRLYTIAQIINVMEDTALKLEEAHKNNNKESFEKAKNVLLELQKKLTEEIGE